MGNQQATPTECAWLAAILEGEGHISLAMRKQRSRPNYVAAIEITNTDPLLIYHCRAVIRKLGVEPYLSEKSGGKATKKKVWRLVIHRFNSAKRILESVLPYLKSKQKRAIKILQFIAARQSYGDRNPPYTASELAIVSEFQKLHWEGESSEAIRKALQKK